MEFKISEGGVGGGGNRGGTVDKKYCTYPRLYNCGKVGSNFLWGVEVCCGGGGGGGMRGVGGWKLRLI